MEKILYIEDDQDTAEAVKKILSNDGFKTEIASTAKKGIIKAKKGFDLILLDIMLSNGSGWDVFQKLKKIKIRSKYIFLSAIPVSTERFQELKREGVSDYITKPFKGEDLIKRIKKALEK